MGGDAGGRVRPRARVRRRLPRDVRPQLHAHPGRVGPDEAAGDAAGDAADRRGLRGARRVRVLDHERVRRGDRARPRGHPDEGELARATHLALAARGDRRLLRLARRPRRDRALAAPGALRRSRSPEALHAGARRGDVEHRDPQLRELGRRARQMGCPRLRGVVRARARPRVARDAGRRLGHAQPRLDLGLSRTHGIPGRVPCRPARSTTRCARAAGTRRSTRTCACATR